MDFFRFNFFTRKKLSNKPCLQTGPWGSTRISLVPGGGVLQTLGQKLGGCSGLTFWEKKIGKAPRTLAASFGLAYGKPAYTVPMMCRMGTTTSVMLQMSGKCMVHINVAEPSESPNVRCVSLLCKWLHCNGKCAHWKFLQECKIISESSPAEKRTSWGGHTRINVQLVIFAITCNFVAFFFVLLPFLPSFLQSITPFTPLAPFCLFRASSVLYPTKNKHTEESQTVFQKEPKKAIKKSKTNKKYMPSWIYASFYAAT